MKECHEATFVIHDETDPKQSKKITFRCLENSHQITINCEGYGDMTSTPGSGSPASIEFCDGKLRLVAWGDINQEDPTHTISLEDAKESRRDELAPVNMKKFVAKIEAERRIAADKAFEAYNFANAGPSGIHVCSHNGWETDGPDILVKRLYFKLQNDIIDRDSQIGSFIVAFYPNESKIDIAYTDLYISDAEYLS